ncbi:MAG: hypothetical protein PHT32_09535 [Candidatus Omnitrophica bacterium]|nr:hypothetical protein [Candidatus Omnitrophota bacterium]
MKILLRVKDSPEQVFLMELIDKTLIQEVKRLIGRKRHCHAMHTILAHARFEREMANHEIPDVKAELFLSKERALWDLMA